ncbi:MAG: hypothetical protein B6U76_12030 [Desulfurococcales archaeon ex4484_217_2]|nr:MAG: hypothetical protein B6U76_12030 [Desulfurococcales archaeon ex4484_217_2]
MSTLKVVALFVVGLFLALLTFPTAFFISAALGYVFGIIAIVIGTWLVARRAGRMLPLVLGVVLAVIAIVSLGATAAVHIGLYAVGKGLEEVTKTKHVSASTGQTITVDNWKITVLGAKEAKYLREGEDYYSAKEGVKAIIVTIRIENAGKDIESLSEIWSLILVTNTNKSYERSYKWDLELLWEAEVTGKVKASAVKYRELDLLADLAPGTLVEGDILFVIPENEYPVKLYFKVGIVGPTVIEVKLS